MAEKHFAIKNFMINSPGRRKIYFLADRPHLSKIIKKVFVAK